MDFTKGLSLKKGLFYLSVMTYYPELNKIKEAREKLGRNNVVLKTPLMQNQRLSKIFESDIYFKREDLQQVRSYKIRGAYNKISGLSEEQMKSGVICSSAGNHAQGVAYSCKQLNVPGVIVMPSTTSRQKVEQVKMFGEGFVKVILSGDTFDDAQKVAKQMAGEQNLMMIPPFDDPEIIEGQATIALELLEQLNDIDYLIVPVGGGGLAAGVSAVLKELSPKTKIIGVEPAGAPSMSVSINNDNLTTLSHIDKFVDGAAVKRVGELTFDICKKNLDSMLTVEEGKVCQDILELYNRDAIVAEPAGALSIAALEQIKDKIRGKKVVCILSGSNNDITRSEEIRERALLYEGLKHYFIVRFPQRAGALREFLNEVLGPDDDITHFEYTKKHNREKGPAIVGIELKRKSDLQELTTRMMDKKFFGEYLNDNPDLFQVLL